MDEIKELWDMRVERRRARDWLNNAVKSGRIIRSDQCQICGKRGSCEAHHADYGRPFWVIWVCSDCHKAADQRAMDLAYEN